MVGFNGNAVDETCNGENIDGGKGREGDRNGGSGTGNGFVPNDSGRSSRIILAVVHNHTGRINVG